MKIGRLCRGSRIQIFKIRGRSELKVNSHLCVDLGFLPLYRLIGDEPWGPTSMPPGFREF